MNLNVVKKITIRGETQGVDQASASVNKLQQAYDRNARAMEMATLQMQQYAQMERQSVQFRQASIDSINRLAAANDNLASSIKAANDNSRQATASFHFTGIEAASTANHLKTAAIAAYALSPAFRSFANPLVANALKAIGPAAATAAGIALTALTPLFSFLARVALPIYAAVKAFQYLANSAAEGLRDFGAFQAQQVTLQNTLIATGGASGRTAAEINRLAEGLGDIGNSRQAARALLEFQTVSGTAFDRALKAAHDLSAAGMGDVTNAAKAMGKALENPASGLDAFTAAGVRFTLQQKALIKDLVETGRAAEAQDKILGIVEAKVGGSAAAAANTLSGAYRSLADATLKGSEQFGAQIASVLRLQSVIQGLADGIHALNAISLSDNARNAIASILSASPVTRALGSMIRPSTRRTNDPFEEAAGVALGAQSAGEQRRKDQIDAVTTAIEKETRALRESDLQKQIDANLRKAQVAAGSAEASLISDLTTKKYNEAEAIKAAEEARREDEATAKRQGEQLRRLDADRQNRLTQMDVERRSIGMSAESALALRLREEELGKLRRAGISETPALVAEIDAWAQGYAKVSVANDKLRDGLRDLKDHANDFAKTFVKGMLDGKSAADAAMLSLDRIGDKLLDKGIETAITGALSGDPAAMAAGSVQALIAVGIKLFTGADAERKRQAEKQQQAWQAWKDAAFELKSYFAKARGTSVGSIEGDVESFTQEAVRLIKLRAEAIGDAAAGWDAEIQKILDGLEEFKARLRREFADTFSVRLDALRAGRGPNDEFTQAAEGIKKIGIELHSFVADAAFVFGDSSTQALQAREAAQAYALTLLDTKEPLSDVAKAVAEITGKADALDDVLISLGMSAAQAGEAIAAGVLTALNALRTKFEGDIQRQINELSGRGFLNSFSDLFTQDATRRADAARLGLGTGGIDTLFGLEAQRIVDDAGLVGDAFRDLIRAFPELAGVVHESTAAVEQAAEDQRRIMEEQVRSINSSALTVLEYLNDLTSGPSSTLSPQEIFNNAAAAYNANLTIAQGNPTDQATIDATNKFVQFADNLEKAARSLFGSATGYQDVRNQIISQGLALPAVQASDDPVVVALRDVIAAVNAGTVATGGVTTAVGSVITNTGGISTIVTNTAGISTVATNTAGIATVATNTAEISQVATNTGGISSVVTNTGGISSIATNTSVLPNAETNIRGITVSLLAIPRMEHNIGQDLLYSMGINAGPLSTIATNTGGIQTVANNTGAIDTVATNTGGIQSIATNTGGIATIVTNTNGVTTIVTNTGETAGNIGASDSQGLRALQNTAKEQLQLLNNQLSGGAIPAPVAGALESNRGRADPGGTIDLGALNTQSTNNNLLLALNKIVFNTAAIALNTFQHAKLVNSNVSVSLGKLAQGGWIGGNLHSQGGTLIEAERGEFMVNRFAADALRPFMQDINRGRLPVLPAFGAAANDNGALLAEVRKLRESNERLERIVAGAGAQTAQEVRDSSGRIVASVDGQTDKLSTQDRQTKRARRA